MRWLIFGKESCPRRSPGPKQTLTGVESIRSLANTMADKANIGVEKMERSNSLNAAGSFLWRGPSFMSRMAGHEAPHKAPRATETKMRKVSHTNTLISAYTSLLVDRKGSQEACWPQLGNDQKCCTATSSAGPGPFWFVHDVNCSNHRCWHLCLDWSGCQTGRVSWITVSWPATRFLPTKHFLLAPDIS